MSANSTVQGGAGARRPAPLWRTDLIGRVTLYGFTAWGACLAGWLVTSLTWILFPTFVHEWFMSVHRMLEAGIFLFGFIVFLNLMVFFRFLTRPRDYKYVPLQGVAVHAALTAFDDEVAIRRVVADFKSVPEVSRVVVVDNNSSDGTRRAAIEAGADEVVIETIPGYGSCCMRALAEASRGADVIILCEGDMTFSATDVRKLLAYLENCDLVLGTRATQELCEPGTQMDWLLNPANQLVAKLIQLRFWGTRLTDVGCTYRAIRIDAYRRLAPRLHVRGNHFSPHMFIEALKMNMRVIEIPVSFRQRVGVSKGVGSNKLKAARVGLRMLGLLYRA